MTTATLDERDAAAVAAAQSARNALPAAVREGDFVEFACGTLRRVSHVWRFPADKDGPAVFSVQTSDNGAGSFHMHTTAGGILGGGTAGLCSYSGGLHPGVEGDTLTDTGRTAEGRVWVWHHGQARAHNGVDALVTFRVWACTEVAR